MPDYKKGIELVEKVWNYTEFSKEVKAGFNISSVKPNLLQSCSPKIFEIVKYIKNNRNKLHIIYSEYLQVNIPLVRALQANGFSEFTKEMISTNVDDGLRYMFYTGTSLMSKNQEAEENEFRKLLENKGEGKATKERDIILKKIFNQNTNKNGEKIQVIIINSAAAEGITIKNVRFVHLLHLPSNMSKIFQIIGRAIRNCTHATLERNEQKVKPILYLDSDNTEKKYKRILKTNSNNIPYLNVIKESAIDCLFNNKIDGSLNCLNFEETNKGISTTVVKTPWVGYEKLCEIEKNQPPVDVEDEKEKDKEQDEAEKQSDYQSGDIVKDVDEFFGRPISPISTISPTSSASLYNTISPPQQTNKGKRKYEVLQTMQPQRKSARLLRGGTKKTKPMKHHKKTIQRNKKTKKHMTKKYQRAKKHNKYTIRN
jgi:superfamily II DNA/RNA helicase